MTWHGPGPGRPPMPLDVAAISAAYLSGQTLDQIALALGVSNTTVKNKLARAGIARRARSHGRKGGRNPFIHLSAARIQALYLQGCSTRNIACQMNCSQSTIIRRLHQAGVVLRSEGWTS